ncbi:MAG: hypothetical protein EPN43_09695 [Jatrophihabitans sp.]|nr:MAG: hypothetical protein EPN43_09695 [Jatrophihabitans sp.]
MIIPRDMADLYLAPVVLSLEEQLRELGRLEPEELASRLALESGLPDWTRSWRERTLTDTLRHGTRLHGWELSVEGSGLRVENRRHSVVIALPETVRAYLSRPVQHQPAQG